MTIGTTAAAATRTSGIYLTALAARGARLAAFDGRCIPAGCVAPRSHTPGMLGRRALPAGRLARLGATPDVHHGLLVADHNESTCHVRPSDSELTALSAQVRSEYQESPGLSDAAASLPTLATRLRHRDVVLQALVSTGFLRLTKNGMFVRTDVQR